MKRSQQRSLFKFSITTFLYRGSDDRAFCFYCGVSIYQWADTDIPEIEHAKYWSACAYLERTFGTGFINQHNNFRIPEEEFLSETRFGFATPEEATYCEKNDEKDVDILNGTDLL